MRDEFFKNKIFLDTNIIVYNFSTDEIKKQIAIDILKNAHNAIISYQVIQEFCNIAFKKLVPIMTESKCITFVEKYLYPICMINPCKQLIIDGIKIHKQYNYSFYDSLIIAAALITECRYILSEDMQNNHKINQLEIINPFIERW